MTARVLIPPAHQRLDAVEDALQPEDELKIWIVRLVEHPGGDHPVQRRELLGLVSVASKRP